MTKLLDKIKIKHNIISIYRNCNCNFDSVKEMLINVGKKDMNLLVSIFKSVYGFSGGTRHKLYEDIIKCPEIILPNNVVVKYVVHYDVKRYILNRLDTLNDEEMENLIRAIYDNSNYWGRTEDLDDLTSWDCSYPKIKKFYPLIMEEAVKTAGYSSVRYLVWAAQHTKIYNDSIVNTVIAARNLDILKEFRKNLATHRDFKSFDLYGELMEVNKQDENTSAEIKVLTEEEIVEQVRIVTFKKIDDAIEKLEAEEAAKAKLTVRQQKRKERREKRVEDVSSSTAAIIDKI